MKHSYEELLELVVRDIPIIKQEKVYGIAFIGLPGVGKTTVANKLSEKMGLYITANDKIRRLLEGLGYDVEHEYRTLVESLANDRTKYMLKNGVSMIIDANMNGFYEMALNNFYEYDAKLFFIKLECSEEVILDRIDKRLVNKELNNYSKAGRESYFANKEKFKLKPFPEKLIFATINTEDNIDSQIDEVVDRLLKFIN